MLPKINPTETQAWKELQEHFKEMKHTSMKDLFAEDANRFDKFSLAVPDIIYDFSKNIINDKTLHLLLQLAEECKLQDAIDAMFSWRKD